MMALQSLHPVSTLLISLNFIRSFIMVLVLCPCLACAQVSKEDYIIYSKYLKGFEAEKKTDIIYFVVRDSTAYYNEDYLSDISTTVNELTAYLKGDQKLYTDIYFPFRNVLHYLTTDTLWAPVIAGLDQKLKQRFKIYDQFSPDLHTTVIDNNFYKKYFGRVKHIEKNWSRFHKQYPMPSALVQFSEISGDGQRAVFYFSWRCGGLCGGGGLAFCQKKDNEWMSLGYASIWDN